MSDFHHFSSAVHDAFKEMSKGELFVTDIDPDELYALYLRSFPPGTNPVYISRTEHDCSCCKQFIRNIGAVVSIHEGKLKSVWDVSIDHPTYRVVAAALNEAVSKSNVRALFRSKEAGYGSMSTLQKTESGLVLTWNHFHAAVKKAHYAPKDKGTQQGEYASAVQVFRRGLTELSPTALEDVLDLIKDNSLYRGEEHAPAVEAFQTLRKQYEALETAEERDAFIWANAAFQGARFRNTVIGTLVQDLSEGVELEKAVKAFEAKVAPANYKRPKALITPSMVQAAMKTIQELGIEPSLERRFAKLSDVTVNNVLWADKSAKNLMKSSLEDVLMKAATRPKAPKILAEHEISVDDFLEMLPKFTSMEVELTNKHSGNLVSLTAPVNADSPNIFKWDNGFAWSYSGNVADSDLRREVERLGGRVDGAFRFTHRWNYGKRNASLMDLHVFMPGCRHVDGQHDTYPRGRRVGWNNRADVTSGGVQDVDYTSVAPVGYVPVENITFPDVKRMPEGEYICAIHNWRWRQPTEAGVQCEIEFEGNIYQYEIERPLANKEWVTVAVVTLKDGKFSIEHRLPHGDSSREVWGLTTEAFVKVNTVLLSPNHWDGSAVGNKHVFFILDGCKNPDATRGVYNEFLRSDLDKHRKVFEVLGDKTKCPPADDQLSGLGFSSTKEGTLVVRASGPGVRQVLHVKF